MILTARPVVFRLSEAASVLAPISPHVTASVVGVAVVALVWAHVSPVVVVFPAEVTTSTVVPPLHSLLLFLNVDIEVANLASFRLSSYCTKFKCCNKINVDKIAVEKIKTICLGILNCSERRSFNDKFVLTFLVTRYI